MHEDKMLFKNLIRKLLETLKLFMNLGISHNDIKPENVLLSFKDFLQIKLIDFGSCTFKEDSKLP